MAKNGSPTVLWLLAGLALGTTVALIAASRTKKGRAVYARAKEAQSVAKDAVDVLRRGNHLKRPLNEG